MSALQQQLFTAITDGLFYLDTVGLLVGDIGFRMTGHPIEVAELTVGDADVGGVQVSVDDPGDLVVRLFHHPQAVTNLHQFRKRCVFKEKHPFFHGQPFQSEGFFIQIGELHNRRAKLQQPSGILVAGGLF